MKTCTTFFLLLFVCLNLKAQNNTFPTDNTTWTNRYQDYWYDSNTGTLHITYEQYTKYCVYGTDTTINAINYNEIFTCDLLGSNYFGALRENAGQVFFVPADSTSEYLLYDFSLNIGDSQDVIVGESSFQTINVQVSSIDTVTINNKQRRRFHLNAAYPWIEGIGSTSGLFMMPYGNVSNYFVDLICVSTDDTIVYDFGNINSGPVAQGIPGNCDLALTIDEADIAVDFSIYPSPTNGSINIELKNDSQIETIRIINTVGQVISTFNNLSSGVTEFEIGGPIGVYFIEIYTENNQKIVQKIIKQ